MEKLNPKTDGASVDIVVQNIERLKQIFPDAFTEGKVDFDILRETLGEYVDDRSEKYSFTWNGKSKARRIAQVPSTGTLRPCLEDSVNWATTKNIFIEGDNLEVLKLLQKAYHKKIKMIYIDPPYNTGKEFIYPDKYQDNLQTYLRYTGQTDGQGFKLSTNSESSGRYHTNWLNMMFPRLKLARNLLRDDGAIFISIDDSEVRNLRNLCDEVFGEENFVVPVIWQKRITPENRRAFSYEHDYVVCYARSADVFAETRRLLPLTDEARARYRNPDDDSRGDWQSVPAIAQAGHGTKSQFYKLKTPDGRLLDPPEGCCWRYTEARMVQEIADNRIWFGANGQGVPRIKRFLSDTRQGITPSTLWFAADTGANEQAKKQVSKLLSDKVVFDNPKPTGLIQRMLDITTETGNSDIVLDFFAGSGTTGHAVMLQNSGDNGNRRYVLVQLPEHLDPENKGQKTAADFCDNIGMDRTIAELTKERLRRSIMRLTEDAPLFTEDLGFKVFKLDSSNIKPWDADFDNLETSLFNAVENIKPDRSEADVLYELLLKYGLDLAVPIEERKVHGKAIYIIGAGALIVCLAKQINLQVVEGIAALKDELKSEVMRVVLKDSGFEDDVVKTNAVQILRQAGIDDVKSL